MNLHLPQPIPCGRCASGWILSRRRSSPWSVAALSRSSLLPPPPPAGWFRPRIDSIRADGGRLRADRRAVVLAPVKLGRSADRHHLRRLRVGPPREQLGEAEANLPTALVDARARTSPPRSWPTRSGRWSAGSGSTPRGAVTVDSVLRLAPASVAPVADAAGTGRRPGPASPTARATGGRCWPSGTEGVPGVSLASTTTREVFASSANGWYAARRPGHARASAIVAVDNKSLVLGTVDAPKEPGLGEMGAATWWLDPKAPPPICGLDIDPRPRPRGGVCQRRSRRRDASKGRCST